MLPTNAHEISPIEPVWQSPYAGWKPALRSATRRAGSPRSGFTLRLTVLLLFLASHATIHAEDTWWSVKPVVRPSPPGNSPNPVDSFIKARLAEKGMSMSPQADRRTLIRRLYFDLLGLPPTPKQVTDFINDLNPKAYENLVEELLKSPHFGERWAQHWLDIAHYADTHGFERDKLRVNAWRYRDYVIKSFNEDKPYNQFIREQIAGDVIDSKNPEAVTATGFLAAGPFDFVGQKETKSPILRRAARADDLDDMVTQVMTATMGITINCARCHDHKLDPISQKEYYQLWSVFAGVQRDDREIDINAATGREENLKQAKARLGQVRSELGHLTGEGLDLADYVGGGDGRGTGVKNRGINVRNGNLVMPHLGYQRDIQVNRLQKLSWPGDPKDAHKFLQWVFVPDGRTPVPVAYKLMVTNLPPTSGHFWDAIRNGKLQSQVHAKIDGVDYSKDGHTILGLHANGGACFNLREIRDNSGFKEMRFTAMVGFGAGESVASTRAGFSVYVDQDLKFQQLKMRKDAAARIDIKVPATAKYLTLVATDGSDGIGHDLLFLGDPKLTPAMHASKLAEGDRQRLEELRSEEKQLAMEVNRGTNPDMVYAIATEKPSVIKVLNRGSPEDTGDVVTPGTLGWAKHARVNFGDNETPEGERRRQLADWIAHPENPLTRRVIVNRLWHYHFGQGLVSTPSDFGRGGRKPSHPQLLDFLADELRLKNWSLKAIHRLIVTSEAYQQTSLAADIRRLTKSSAETDQSLLTSAATGAEVDAGNRLLWRQNPRRLDAESIRDAVLAVTGKLNPTMGGPGYRDFKYTEAYAPIYEYVTPDTPELWRRSIYRFIVRTTPHKFMTTLDCPDPATLAPVRNRTTTPLQSLALLNNEFMLKQSGYFAKRVESDAGENVEKQVRLAFELAFGRGPDTAERKAADNLIGQHGLFALCRMLMNANEFVYVD